MTDTKHNEKENKEWVLPEASSHNFHHITSMDAVNFGHPQKNLRNLIVIERFCQKHHYKVSILK